ncbi:MAG TPA: hypothetical protein VLD61_06825 [Methylomirabilota bacterium]|nr:hypothetical protein [Methylomirabilota bacterium]
MRSVRLGLVLMGAALMAGACATPEQWKEWRAHSTHFASGDHLTFSMKNRSTTPHVSSQDVRMAAAQTWWGDPVVVRPDQIFSN